jgi:hypothetical protein
MLKQSRRPFYAVVVKDGDEDYIVALFPIYTLAGHYTGPDAPVPEWRDSPILCVAADVEEIPYEQFVNLKKAAEEARSKPKTPTL